MSPTTKFLFAGSTIICFMMPIGIAMNDQSLRPPLKLEGVRKNVGTESARSGLPKASIMNPSVLKLRGGSDNNIYHSHNFELRRGVQLKTVASRGEEGVDVYFTLEGETKGLTLHWGVSSSTADEWIIPQKVGCAAIMPPDSVMYKERAIRTPLRSTNGRWEAHIQIPEAESKKLIGLRFTMFEPSSDRWYPGGAGGNFFVPIREDFSKPASKRPPALQRSPSFTGGVDIEEMQQKMSDPPPQPKPGSGGVVLTSDITHLMWNAAQRGKAWVDGKKESVAMRLQRSPSFESAVQILSKMQEEQDQHKKEAEDFFKNQGGRLYVIPFYYQSKGSKKGQVRVKVIKETTVTITVEPERGDAGPGPLLLHWGVGPKSPREWKRPESQVLSSVVGGAESALVGDAAQTPLRADGGVQTIEFSFEAGKSPQGITFVFKDTSNSAWYKPDSGNFCVPVSEAGRAAMDSAGGKDHGEPSSGMVRTLSGTIIPPLEGADVAKQVFEAEKQGHVTLMHRYQAALRVLEQTPPGEAGINAITMVFIWLRFSQIRQLSWQRNYNTKPRELSAASENLNKAIAWRWKNAGSEEKELFRLMLGCIGRGGSGGDGQAIRDEILHIMHRHHLPETKGNFIEEWHQKLHNNSTPDDIAICMAFLAFLASNGNMAEFDRVLAENGLNRERLKTYERPITTAPCFYGDKKDGLINDFNNYLRILKNVHAGADLEKCVEVCRGFLDGHVNLLLESILRERSAHGDRVLAVIDSITEVRQLIGLKMSKEGDIVKLRDMLYLDIGLEAQMRLMAERSLGQLDRLNMESLTRSLALWISLTIENLIYSSSPGVGVLQGHPDSVSDEFKACLRDWAGLVEEAHKGYGPGFAVKAMAVVERMRRALASVVDKISTGMQKKAEYLGYGLCAVTPEKIPEKWSITLFSEELIRGGGCSFVLSTLLRKLDRALRAQGGGTRWQVISAGKPSGVVGELVEVRDLLSVQDVSYDKPTVLLASSVSGEEEVPPGVVGVITPDAPDVLAHISVRARNLKVFFATCFDSDEFESLSKFAGRRVTCSRSGDSVSVREAQTGEGEEAKEAQSAASQAPVKIELPPPAKFSNWCLPEKSIDPDRRPKIFGAKSTNIVKVRKQLPEWVQTPRSAVVPFGVFEKVLEAAENKAVATEYTALAKEAAALAKGTGEPHEVLRRLRETVLKLQAPKAMVDELRTALLDSGIIKQGELQGKEWDEAWHALKGVWASKWNDRAFYSCKKAAIGQQHVQMAVLVQRLVEAEYAFVVHTVNPSNGDKQEMYAEVVVGLGEVLVGNFPGRALGFAMRKDGKSPARVVSLPSKSVGLFGGGLIFRSDSNGEDLPGFAGAGLYDSVPMVHNKKRTLMYNREPLVVDPKFADKIMKGICKLAVDVEAAMGGEPQDIEGCYKGGGVLRGANSASGLICRELGGRLTTTILREGAELINQYPGRSPPAGPLAEFLSASAAAALIHRKPASPGVAGGLSPRQVGTGAELVGAEAASPGLDAVERRWLGVGGAVWGWLVAPIL
eukprot:CAMPEP_0113682442 /NCGR_PEP_ID=MMETSP0038_2-20120614/12666_1 /TAXON_ID=2898 /ORGANISM="Cryptomonas paramecium" /LENGTH=1530 /DNA_ID=CAMNT_0000601513 /DNA_START=87 /DNA_END=4675 /DNA_ORIENTATION=- /assembly_acc=CAM_ASM_000170